MFQWKYLNVVEVYSMYPPCVWTTPLGLPVDPLYKQTSNQLINSFITSVHYLVYNMNSSVSASTHSGSHQSADALIRSVHSSQLTAFYENNSIYVKTVILRISI